MSRFLRAALVLVLLAACGGGSREYAAPRDLDDACAIIRERPQYMRAMAAAERKWGVPVHVQMATIHQESKFIGNAQTPHRWALGVIPMGRQSTAYGYSQALNGTWEEYLEETGRRGARRDRIDDATDFMGWYFTARPGAWAFRWMTPRRNIWPITKAAPAMPTKATSPSPGWSRWRRRSAPGPRCIASSWPIAAARNRGPAGRTRPAAGLSRAARSRA